MACMQGCLTLYGGVKVPGWAPQTSLWSWEAVAVYLGFLGVQILLHLVLPGKTGTGVKLRNGSQLKYKFTGEQTFVIGKGPLTRAGHLIRQPKLRFHRREV